MTSLIRGFDESLRDSIRELGPNTLFVAKFSGLSFASGKEFKDLQKFVKENGQLLSPDAKQAYAMYEKAAKEAKLHTSWINPNEPYETGVSRFVAGAQVADETLEVPGGGQEAAEGDPARGAVRWQPGRSRRVRGRAGFGFADVVMGCRK